MGKNDKKKLNEMNKQKKNQENNKDNLIINGKLHRFIKHRKERKR